MILSKLFGGGDKSTSTTIDPYKKMPAWQKKYFKAEAGDATRLIGQGRGVTRKLARKPQKLEQVSAQEQAALAGLNQAGAKATGLADVAAKAASGVTDKAVGLTTQALGQTASYADPRAALDALYEKNENAYTDDVVDTTLAQMQREQARLQAQRGASAASIGGLNSTRAAVADALGEQLGRMDMAQTEATLRSDAFDKSRELGQSEFELGLSRDEKQNQLQFDKTDVYDKNARLGLDEAAGLDALADSRLARGKTIAEANSTQGAQKRQIRDLNKEAKRTAQRDALSWYGDFRQKTRGLTSPTATQQTTTQSGGGGGIIGDILGTAGQALSIYNAIPSDRRVKTDIEKEPDAAGLEALSETPGYTYRYRDDEEGGITAGLMAQDLEGAIPGAVGEDEDGVKRVDLYPVVATLVQAVRELDKRTRELAR